MEAKPNVENPAREVPLVETEVEKSKKQMEKAAQELAEQEEEDGEEHFFASGDTEKKFPIPVSYKSTPGYVVVKQEREIEVAGVGPTLVPHPSKFQIYNAQVYKKMTTPNADNRTQFDDLGIKPTILHDTRTAKQKK